MAQGGSSGSRSSMNSSQSVGQGCITGKVTWGGDISFQAHSLAVRGPQRVHFQASSQGCWQVSVPCGLLDQGPQVLVGCWQERLVSYHVGLPTGQLDMGAGFPRRKQAGK